MTGLRIGSRGEAAPWRLGIPEISAWAPVFCATRISDGAGFPAPFAGKTCSVGNEEREATPRLCLTPPVSVCLCPSVGERARDFCKGSQAVRFKGHKHSDCPVDLSRRLCLDPSFLIHLLDGTQSRKQKRSMFSRPELSWKEQG